MTNHQMHEMWTWAAMFALLLAGIIAIWRFDAAAYFVGMACYARLCAAEYRTKP